MLILRGGANIYPAEVERVLLGATGVKGVAVVGFPDERLGHRVAAAIETDSGADLDVAKLTELCSRELAYYKVPERWRFAILPRNAMGRWSERTSKTGFPQPSSGYRRAQLRSRQQ